MSRGKREGREGSSSIFQQQSVRQSMTAEYYVHGIIHANIKVKQLV